MLHIKNKGEKEPEPDKFSAGILNTARQKQKRTNLGGVLTRIKNPHLKDRFKTLFSKKSLTQLGMNENEAIAVLGQLDAWARSGEWEFDTWDLAITAALAEVRKKTSLGSPSTVVSKSVSRTESNPETQLCEMCMDVARSCGFTFTAKDCKFIRTTPVSMHTKGKGSKASSKNFKFAYQTIFQNSKVIIECVTFVDPICKVILLDLKQFDSRSFLLNLLRVVVGGTIVQGKFRMLQESMCEMATLLPALDKLRSQSIHVKAWRAICDSVLKTIREIEPKVMVKLCRELRTAKHLLEADPSLMLSSYEAKISGSKGALAEFDLQFISRYPGFTATVEVESEKGTSVAYYAKVWSEKAKRFREFRFSGSLCFTIASPHFLNKETAAKIRRIAKHDFKENLTILTNEDQTLTSRVKLRRRNSFSGSDQSPVLPKSAPTRPRSKSVGSGL